MTTPPDVTDMTERELDGIYATVERFGDQKLTVSLFGFDVRLRHVDERCCDHDCDDPFTEDTYIAEVVERVNGQQLDTSGHDSAEEALREIREMLEPFRRDSPVDREAYLLRQAIASGLQPALPFV